MWLLDCSIYVEHTSTYFVYADHMSTLFPYSAVLSTVFGYKYAAAFQEGGAIRHMQGLWNVKMFEKFAYLILVY